MVTTIKDAGARVVVGPWRITGRPSMPDAGAAVSVTLPFTVSVDKATGRCCLQQTTLSETFRGANLAAVLDEAATAWCRSV